MAKLIYRTKKPRTGFVFNESFMTHEDSRLYDKFPSKDVQKEAMEFLQEKMYEITKKLDTLGYDPTRLRFSIHTKE